MNSPATLLIVDDVPANLGVVVDSLDHRGFRVLVAQDGEEALARAARVGPDLILLDVMMPGIDGFEVCRRLKADAATRDIPVIFMTALADTPNKLAGFEAGGVDYVTKPFDMPEVLARIDTHLALRALQVRLGEQNAELRAANARLAEAQAQLVQADKMASIGLLAAGIAHEINNPLGFVSANLATLAEYGEQLLAALAAYAPAEAVLADAAPALFADIVRARETCELDYVRNDLPNLVAESQDGLERVKKIVQSLKEFSHVGEAGWQFADINRGLDSTLNMVAHELKYKATVCRDYADLPEVECLPMELNQVFMNLLVNAAQSIPEYGEISVRTGRCGDEVWVEIADTGAGIAPEHLARIFDPFFTTKPVGQGTGLGLSISYATVRKHGGRIEVRSTPGSGTAFVVHLPLRRPAGD